MVLLLALAARALQLPLPRDPRLSPRAAAARTRIAFGWSTIDNAFSPSSIDTKTRRASKVMIVFSRWSWWDENLISQQRPDRRGPAEIARPTHHRRTQDRLKAALHLQHPEPQYALFVSAEYNHIMYPK